MKLVTLLKSSDPVWRRPSLLMRALGFEDTNQIAYETYKELIWATSLPQPGNAKQRRKARRKLVRKLEPYSASYERNICPSWLRNPAQYVGGFMVDAHYQSTVTAKGAKTTNTTPPARKGVRSETPAAHSRTRRGFRTRPSRNVPQMACASRRGPSSVAPPPGMEKAPTSRSHDCRRPRPGGEAMIAQLWTFLLAATGLRKPSCFGAVYRPRPSECVYCPCFSKCRAKVKGFLP